MIASCPFCGNAAFLRDYDTALDAWPVECGLCSASVTSGDSPERAVAIWNTRTVANPREVPDALRYILWRYGQDHRGEDHQERAQGAPGIARAWLGAQGAPQEE